MNKIIVFASLFLFGCSSFDKIAKVNKFDKEEGYNSFTNSELKLKSLSFGDVFFASNLAEFKKLSPEKKPEFKNIIVYGKTIYDPIYDYYVLSKDDFSRNENYTTIDSSFTNSKFIIKISKNIPKDDYSFILKNLTPLQ